MSYPTLAEAVAAIAVQTAKWQGGIITYSIPVAGSTWAGYAPGSEPFDPSYRTLTSEEAAAFRVAIAAWSRLTAVEFVETNDLTAPGQIRIAVSNTGSATGYAKLLGGGTGPQYGDIWFSAKLVSFTNPGSFGLLHEIGHALGLKHTFDPSPVVPVGYESPRYSIMSYLTGSDDFTWLRKVDGQYLFYSDSVRFAGPMVFDIAAIQSLYGANSKTGAGDTTYSWSQDAPFMEAVYDASGVDTFDLSKLTRPSIVDLTPGAYSSVGYWSVEDQLAQVPDLSALPPIWKLMKPEQLYTWSNNVGIAFSTVIENVIGGSAGDTLKGNAVANRITGGGGNDVIDGGAGVDAAVYTSASKDYSWTLRQDGAWEVRDRRANGGEGVDVLRNIEVLKFSDIAVALPVATTPSWGLALTSILRLAPSGWDKAQDAGRIVYATSGGLTDGQALAEIVKSAAATTSVAAMNYQFFTGKIPSQLGVDFLVSPTGPNTANLNSDYYAQFNMVNRYINFAVNLGKNGEGKDAFAAKYGALSLFDAAREAYKTIFGAAPTDANTHALIDTRVDYFAYYGGDGPNGIGTKAAMVGWLLAEAEKADLGVMARSNHAWLIDLSDGSAPFAINILDPAQGYYKADFVFGGA